MQMLTLARRFSRKFWIISLLPILHFFFERLQLSRYIIDWTLKPPTSAISNHLILEQKNSALIQLIEKPMRQHQTLHLLPKSSLDIISSSDFTVPFSSSDHNSITFALSLCFEVHLYNIFLETISRK